MANNSGNDTRFQIGLESEYASAATPTKQLEMLNESLGEVHNNVVSDALVGAVTSSSFTIVGKKVEGDLSMEVHPDNIGLLMYAALGVEAEPDDTVEAGTVYQHAFTPVSGGDNLPSLTAVVDKKSDVFVYKGLKIDSITLESDPTSLLTSSISFIGNEEEAGGSLESLSKSAFLPYNFNSMALYVGDAGSEADTLVEYATSFSFNYSNNLENDLFTANGKLTMAEIDYQRREITIDFEALYNSESNTFREDFYKTGDELSIKVEFTSAEDVDGTAESNKHKLIVDVRNFVITEAPNSIDGPERLRIPLTGQALEKGSEPAVTVIIQDGQSSKYSE